MRFVYLLAALLSLTGLAITPAKAHAQCAVCTSADGIPDHCAWGPYANSAASCNYTPLFGCRPSGCCLGSGCEPEGPEGLSLAGSVVTSEHHSMFGVAPIRTCNGSIAVVAVLAIKDGATQDFKDEVVL